ncbi:acylphosphatase [Qipengyuania nanhaisediminis]|uniref:acylphosphatase n=1 Tax=Qipengyuania nanhaisediminis TaxID=604088 RepID=UPI0038B31026
MSAAGGRDGHEPDVIARHLVVHGRVQGVFYRDWTVEAARRLGVTGWVRNLADCTVEAHLEGDDEAVTRMIAAMQTGPPRAAPTTIDEHEVAPSGHREFSRR